MLEDWIDQLRSDGEQTVWLLQMSSKALDKAGQPRGDKLLGMWLRQLAASAQGAAFTGLLVARDAVVTMPPLDRDDARAVLAALVTQWRRGMDGPLPVACRTALALVTGATPAPCTTAVSTWKARAATSAWHACGRITARWRRSRTMRAWRRICMARWRHG
nr:hypothetical protein [Pseudoduganella chitinolytica]